MTLNNHTHTRAREFLRTLAHKKNEFLTWRSERRWRNHADPSSSSSSYVGMRLLHYFGGNVEWGDHCPCSVMGLATVLSVLVYVREECVCVCECLCIRAVCVSVLQWAVSSCAARPTLLSAARPPHRHCAGYRHPCHNILRPPSLNHCTLLSINLARSILLLLLLLWYK